MFTAAKLPTELDGGIGLQVITQRIEDSETVAVRVIANGMQEMIRMQQNRQNTCKAKYVP
jgi:hypothetical protein